LAQSRKRRKGRRRAAEARRPPPAEEPRGYARGRAKDEAARAALKPLAPGERPTAVTVGAIVALLLAAANLVSVVAIAAGWDPPGGGDSGQALALSLLGAGVMCLVAWGMWKARYWAVLGMQTVLGLALVFSALSLIGASTVVAMLVLVAIIAAAGTLFWFMVKAMARIQMPERPSRAR
jgi:hypothetical protein